MKRWTVLAGGLAIAFGFGLELAYGASRVGPDGWFVLQAQGFDQNDSGPGDFGQVAALGIIHFDSEGRVLGGTLTLTSADSGGEEATCMGSLSPSTFTPEAVTLIFASGCDGTLVFAWARTKGSPESWFSARLLLTGFTGLTIGAQTIKSLVLAGDLKKQIPQPKECDPKPLAIVVC